MKLIIAAGVLALALTANIGQPRTALAWGDTGHKIVCDLAFRLAAPQTRAEIRRLIGLDRKFDFFADSCTWPDHPRKRASEHFVNLKRDATGIPPDQECPTADTCVLSAIEKDTETLSSSTDDDEKLAALKFLGHWVGDIHQPLHVSFEDDRGGGHIHVTGECSPNLHSAWDNCLVFQAVGDNVTAASRQLFNSLTEPNKEQWAGADPRDWANESFALAEAAKVHYCVRHGTSCDLPSPARVEIDAAYISANVATVREQLAKAGVRLAKLLDTSLGQDQ
jgi:hypothetical protein